MALRNTRNAARLVQSLGDLARLDEPEFGLQAMTVDAGELLDDIVLRFAERAPRSRVELRGPQAAPGATAWLDVELFERALANLLDNALVLPSRRPHRRRTGGERSRLQVTVADSGPGIAAADLPHLFDRFFQGGEGPRRGGLRHGPWARDRQADRRVARRRRRSPKHARTGHHGR